MIEAIREVLDAGSTLIFYTVRDNDAGEIVNEKSNMKDSTRSAIPISTKHNASSDRKWLTEGQFSRPRCSMHQSRFVLCVHEASRSRSMCRWIGGDQRSRS